MITAPDSGAKLASGVPDLMRIARNSIDFRTGEIWYTAQVVGRQEIKFSDKMARAGWKSYTPVERVRSHRQRRERGREEEVRTVEYYRAKWPKYSFFAGPHDAIYAAKKTNLLQKILPNIDQRRLVDQLESLSQHLRMDDAAHQAEPELQAARWYRVIWPHKLAGLMGELIIFEGQLWLTLDLFGGRTPTFIEDKKFLERI